MDVGIYINYSLKNETCFNRQKSGDSNAEMAYAYVASLAAKVNKLPQDTPEV